MEAEQTSSDAPTSSTMDTSQPSSSPTNDATQPSSSSQSDPANSSKPSPPPKQCAHCKAPESEKKELKPCSKCHTALYCSRDCQKAGWKTHKKTCAEDAQRYAIANPPKLASAPRVPKEGHRGGLQKWQFDT